MTKAYKCDRCRHYYEGEPFRRIKFKAKSVSLSKAFFPDDSSWDNKWLETKTVELCKDCYHCLEEFLKY